MHRNTKFAWLVVAAAGLTACGEEGNGNGSGNEACTDAIRAREAAVQDELPWSYEDPQQMIGPANGNQAREADFAGKYRDDLANHPGCAPRQSYGMNVEPLVQTNEADVPAGTPASIPGYPCAAKAYETGNVDTSKPIVILVHGNSSSVTSFEEYSNSNFAGMQATTLSMFPFTIESQTRDQLATRLLDAGFEVYAFDARVDLVATLEDFNPDVMTGNASLNIDHGWAVPMLQSMIKALMSNNPNRRVSLVGHSLGSTVIRDALRRLYIESRDGVAGSVNPFERLQDVVLASGAHHGVVAGEFNCMTFPTQMRGTVTCEMGDRDTFIPTYFTQANNGPADLYTTPCADGSYAFGEEDQCGGNVVQYTTVTMEDIQDGQYQDEFVTEESASLDLEPCVDNALIGLDDFDASGYFFDVIPGYFANHFGAVRANAGMQIIVDRLND